MKSETSTTAPRAKIALVTGASSGIGAATAQRLHRAGYRVYGTSRRAEGLDGGPIAMLTLDVTDDASVEAAVAEVMQRAGRIDVLVNNAGFGVSPAGAEESSLAQARAIFDTNFFGVIRMTRAVLPHMRAQGSGRIINIGSVLGLLPMPYGALYSATKHELEGYSESLDHETRTSGVRVSVIEPAFTQTRFDANLLTPDAMRDEYRNIRAHLSTLLPTQIAKGDDPSVVADIVLTAAPARPLHGRQGRRHARVFASGSACGTGGPWHSAKLQTRCRTALSAKNSGATLRFNIQHFSRRPQNEQTRRILL